MTEELTKSLCESYPRIEHARKSARASIYAFKVGDSVKVGVSTNLHVRYKALKAAGRLLAREVDVHDSFLIENRVHQHLANKQHVLRGKEWYEPSETLVQDVIDAIDAAEDELRKMRSPPAPIENPVEKIEKADDFLKALEEIKHITGWRDAEIARRAGIDKSTITRLKLDGGRQPSPRAKSAIYDVLLIARGLNQKTEGKK